MSQVVRTQSTEAAGRREIFKDPHVRGRRETRAENMQSRALLEFSKDSGGPLKWPSLFYGGEFRAG